MRDREIVIRLSLPGTPRKRWLLGGVAAFLAVGAIAYAAGLVTFTSHTIITAADLNTNFTNLNGRVTTLEGSVAASTVTGALANATIPTANVTGLTAVYQTRLRSAGAAGMVTGQVGSFADVPGFGTLQFTPPVFRKPTYSACMFQPCISPPVAIYRTS